MIKGQSFGRLVVFILLAWLATSCFPPIEPAARPVVPRVPDHFQTRIGLEGEAVVDLQGNVNGHVPGAESVFGLTFRNGSDESWRGHYCIQLLDEQAVLMTLAEDDLALEPGDAESQELVLRFPEDLSGDTYGLGLFVERPDGPFAGVTFIHMGIDAGAQLRPVQEGQTAGPVAPHIPDDIVQAALRACLGD